MFRLTADAKLFAEAVALGSEVIWLHCYGERFADPTAGRPKQAPRMPKESAPTIPKAAKFLARPSRCPTRWITIPPPGGSKIGKGYVENVTPEMWAYEVSGKQVLWHWFSYRRRDRSRPIIGDRRPPRLSTQMQPDHWLPEYTSDLIDLLNVLGRLIALEPKQADLLERICAGRLRSADELRDAGALTEQKKSRRGETQEQKQSVERQWVAAGKFRAATRLGPTSSPMIYTIRNRKRVNHGLDPAKAIFSDTISPNPPTRIIETPNYHADPTKSGLNCTVFSPRRARPARCRGMLEALALPNHLPADDQLPCRRTRPRNCASNSRPSWSG